MSSVNPYTAPQTSAASNEDDALYTPRVFGFKGRIGRLRFLAYSVLWTLAIYGIVMVAGFVFGLVMAVLLEGSNNPLVGFGLIWLFMVIAYAILLLPIFALAVRRFNDMNLSGWLSLFIILFPLYPILWLIFVFVPGTHGTNKFGPRPIENSGAVIFGALAFPIGSVAIIGILAAIALPAYQDYVLRAQVSAVLNEVRPVQFKVEHYLTDNGELPASNQNIDHLRHSDLPSVVSIDVTMGGSIRVEFESKNAKLDRKTLIWRPTVSNGFIQWDCLGGSLDQPFRPRSCTEQK